MLLIHTVVVLLKYMTNVIFSNATVMAQSVQIVHSSSKRAHTQTTFNFFRYISRNIKHTYKNYLFQ